MSRQYSGEGSPLLRKVSDEGLGERMKRGEAALMDVDEEILNGAAVADGPAAFAPLIAHNAQASLLDSDGLVIMNNRRHHSPGGSSGGVCNRGGRAGRGGGGHDGGGRASRGGGGCDGGGCAGRGGGRCDSGGCAGRGGGGRNGGSHAVSILVMLKCSALCIANHISLGILSWIQGVQNSRSWLQ